MKKLINLIKNKFGFTLLEILAALSILAIGLVSVLSLFPMGFQSTKRASEVSVASLYGQQQMETLLSRGFDYVHNNDSGIGTFVNDDYYEWEYNATQDTATDPLMFVVLGVYWPSAKALGVATSDRTIQQNMKFTTYITDYTQAST